MKKKAIRRLMEQKVHALDQRIDVRLIGAERALKLQAKENKRRIRHLEKWCRKLADKSNERHGRDHGISLIVANIIAIVAALTAIAVAYFRS